MNIFQNYKIINVYSCLKDLPSAPVGPLKILNVAENFAEIEWSPPLSDGGTPITMYAIEIREFRRKIWGRAGTVDQYTTKFIAKNLVVNYEYFFRVRAINKEGEGPALECYDSACPKLKLGE